MTAVLIILLVLLLLLSLPVGVSGGYDFGELLLALKIGPVRLQLLPRKLKKPKKAKQEKHGSEKKKKKEKASRLPIPALSFQMITDYVRLGVRTLRRLRHRLRISDLRIWYLAAAEDPSDAALAYGRAHAAVAELLAILHAAFDVRDQDVRLRVDFTETKNQFSVSGTVTIRIGQLLTVAIAALIDFLKILLRQRREAKLKSERTDKYGEPSHRRDDGDDNVKDQGNGGREHDRGHACHNA